MRTLRILTGVAALITALVFGHHILFQDYLAADQQMLQSPIYWAFMVFAVSVVVLAVIGVCLLLKPARNN
jgi:uncharacterized membrane protein